MRLINSTINEVKFDNSLVEGRGRHFVSRFIEAGLVSYEEQGAGVLKLSKEALDRFVYSLVGCPVIIKHQRVSNENVDDIRVGVVSSVNYNTEDGWFWCDGIIWDAEAIKLIEQGWSVSCCYTMTESTHQSGEWHNMSYDDELINGLFEHLAIVPNPRYEEATILLNSKKEKAESMLNMFKRKRVQNAEKDDDVEWITVKGTHIPVKKGQSKEDAVSQFFKDKAKSDTSEATAEKYIKKLEEDAGRELSHEEKAKELKKGGFSKDEAKAAGVLQEVVDKVYKKDDPSNSDLYQKWVDEVKENYPELAENFHISSEEEFKEITGLTAKEYTEKYPSTKEEIKWKKDGLGEKVVLVDGNKKIVVRKNGDVRWYKGGKLIPELNQTIKEDDVDNFILHGVKKGYVVNEKIPSEDGDPMKSGDDSFSLLTNGEGSMADKRKAIREIMAIAAKPNSDFEGGEEEKIKTIASILEKSEYAESESSDDKKENACSEEDKKEGSDEDSKENKCSNEGDSVKESEKEDKGEEKKEKDKKENSEEESEKKGETKENSKGSFDDLKRLSNTANAVEQKVYMSEADRLELGKSLY